MTRINDAKSALDKIIKKSRIHLYKPIQIAEILYRDRIYDDLDLNNLETYRTQSKKWRDDISIKLLGRICTSSARFQDDLFNDNAIPPKILAILGEENRKTKGGVEAYIYALFRSRYEQINIALNYISQNSYWNFNLLDFINLFWEQPGLKRSLDKIFEIIVYSLFSTLSDSLELKVSIKINPKNMDLLEDFQDFTRDVMKIDFLNPTFIQDAKLYRLGTTNAADRGLDMYCNWGTAIQVKHLSLNTEIAENIVNNISSDRIVIVCKSAEKKVILSLLNQIGWQSRIQSILTEDDLNRWYDKALRGKFSNKIGSLLIERLSDEINTEFPSVKEMPCIIKSRHYETVNCWNTK